MGNILLPGRDLFSDEVSEEQWSTSPQLHCHTSALRATRNTLSHLSLQEAAHKICPPAQVMTWLDFPFDTEIMMMIIPEEKRGDTLSVVGEWSRKTRADIHELRNLLGHLCHVAQCYHPAWLFVNHMLATLQACHHWGHVLLSHCLVLGILAMHKGGVHHR